MYRRKSSFRRLGVLLLLAVVGCGTHSNAQTLVGPAVVNDGIKLWLDADKSHLFGNKNCSSSPISTSGQDVECWKDRSGNNSNVTVTKENPSRKYGSPTYLGNKIGGEPVLEFKKGAGENDGLFRSLTSGERWKGDYTLFMVVQQLDPEPAKYQSYFSNGKYGDNLQKAYTIHYHALKYCYEFLTIL